ncbi:mandelate racemase/muconate lactonizing enzyme family protein [Chloroflexota bacterium]
MKIRYVRSYVLEAPMPKPWRFNNNTLKNGYATLVEIETDEGISGVGEALVRLGPSVPKTIIDEVLAPSIIGLDPSNIGALWERMFSLMRFRGHSGGFFMEAISAIDIALWDIAGKVLNLPVYRLMLGLGRTEIPVYASSIFWDTPKNMASEAESLVDQGYRAIKIKIGQGAELDEKCLIDIRKAVGSEIDLMVDANGAYNCTDAVRLGRKLEQLDVRWFEEPVPPDDLEGYRNLSHKLDITIAGGEGVFNIYGMKKLIESGVRVIQPNVARAGGITAVREMAAVAQAFHVPYAPHTGASSAVCMAATMQLAAAIPNFCIYEHIASENPLVNSILHNPLPVPQNGSITVPQQPGIGIELDMKAIAKHHIA